jgi:hypothetical protein
MILLYLLHVQYEDAEQNIVVIVVGKIISHQSRGFVA